MLFDQQTQIRPQASLVKDIMATTIHSGGPTDSVEDAGQLMAHAGIRHLPVVTGDYRLLGILSNRDVLACCSEPGQNGDAKCDRQKSSKIHVQDMMSTNLVTVDPDTTTQQAAAVLATQRIGCLPVVGPHNRLQGIVSTIDLLLCLAKSDDEFQFFMPALDGHRAFFDSTGTLAIARPAVDDIQADQTLSAMVGYSLATGRIAVKLLGNLSSAAEGALPVCVTDQFFKIDAKEFVSHFGIRPTEHYRVENDEHRDLLILTPKRSLHRYKC